MISGTKLSIALPFSVIHSFKVAMEVCPCEGQCPGHFIKKEDNKDKWQKANLFKSLYCVRPNQKIVSSNKK